MATTDSGTVAGEGLRSAAKLAALLVATTYPAAAAARVIVTLPGPGLARLAVPVGAAQAYGPRTRDLIPAIAREVLAYYPEAQRVDVLVELPGGGSPAWFPVSSSTGPSAFGPPPSAS
jgi:hypothetical protein